MKIIYKDGLQIEKNKITQFILKMDNEFPTPISEKTDIQKFVNKLLAYGYINCALDKNEIVGIVGGYANNDETKLAYESILVVDPKSRGNKISISLMDNLLKNAMLNNMKGIEVFTHETNLEAIGLYKKLGFTSLGLNEEGDFHFIKMFYEKLNVLVTAIGSFSADIVIKQLKQKDYRVVGCDIYPKEWIADAYSVNEFYQAPYATDEERYLNFIKDICKKENINYIMPLTDVEVDVFNNNREWFIQNNICICISSKETLDICRNKKTIEEFISQRLNIQTIPTLLMKDVKELSWNYPVVCKPYDGRSSQGLKYINNENEWQEFKQNSKNNKYIVQPFIEGDIITVDIVRGKNKVIAIPRKELLRTLNGAGTSVYVFSDENLEQKCIELANELNVMGCVNFEFIQDKDGNYHFIECNPRFSGGVEFSCIAGFDCVINHIKCFKNEKIDDFKLVHNRYIARKYEEYVTRVE